MRARSMALMGLGIAAGLLVGASSLVNLLGFGVPCIECGTTFCYPEPFYWHCKEAPGLPSRAQFAAAILAYDLLLWYLAALGVILLYQWVASGGRGS